MTMLPLLPPASNDSVIALRSGQPISRATFLRDILALAESLPNDRPILNLCQDRYLFAVCLLAAISRGLVSLLPNSTVAESIAALREREPQLLCLSDQAEAPFGLPHQRVTVSDAAATVGYEAPLIAADQMIAWVFTSGSTGIPQAHQKCFGAVHASVVAEGRCLWAAMGGACAVLGTVPSQHMYGLESVVLMPLLSGGILVAERPYFPADVMAALQQMPAQRLLVTTPFHLRNLLDAELAPPHVAGLLSATAPLARDLAQSAEARFTAPLYEIYGATETGQIACRHTTQTEQWEIFIDIALSQSDGVTYASGPVLPQPVPLGDVLEIVDDRHFNLLGRGADMINIAGKRSSLAFLNSVILRIPGVRDAAFCLPAEHEAGRLAAFVVAPGVSAQTILHGLRDYVDSIFLPRPIVFVDTLPRNPTGKITAAAMQALMAEHLEERR